jgi:hypothetical protein
MLWLRADSGDREIAAWHVWHDGAAYVVSGGLEQNLAPVLDGSERLAVTVRSKDTGGRLVTFVARPMDVPPGDETWDTVVPELHAKRLNPPDGEQQPARWARESRITRIEPTGELLESPGHPINRSHAAEPPGSPAATRGRLPFTLGRPPKRRR